ncbi:MAG: hypothetical protein KC457_05255 [Myxococcales bacterium]|nr:hypothetical protein [Myxococcales bacterium]
MRPHGLLAAGLLATTLALSGCGREEGIVEVYWQLENADLDRLYPQGLRNDTCAFDSVSGERFDVQVQLTVAENSPECAVHWSDPACVIVEQLRFDCTRARGTATSVPISSSGSDDPGYLMFVEATMVPEGGEPFVPMASCMQGPGARVRRVLPGRTTDLEVYEFVFRALQSKLQTKVDIDLCRDGSSTDTTDSGGTDSDTGTDTGTSTGP